MDFDPYLWRIELVTNDGLVAYKRSGGLEGSTLVPDLAASIPAPTDGGKTYTFYLRPHLTYSTGRSVRASDFRTALERVFRLKNGGYFTELRGGALCEKKPPTCSLAKGVVTDDAAGTVTFHLVTADPDFLYKLALPTADVVPAGVPDHLPRGGSVPATGPYHITTFRPPRTYGAPGLLVLARNPHFRQWSAAAQPQGYPSEIRVQFGVPEKKQLEAVTRGTADLIARPGVDAPVTVPVAASPYPSRRHRLHRVEFEGTAVHIPRGPAGGFVRAGPESDGEA
jgi:peptide/nickel transport system substrate-binding protein